MAIEALMPNLSSASIRRQNPTRLPYSCQVQLGISGVGTPPAGGVFTVRGIGELMSHSSIETSTQTATLLPAGRASFGRPVMGEYGRRSIGNMATGPFSGRPGGRQDATGPLVAKLPRAMQAFWMASAVRAGGRRAKRRIALSSDRRRAGPRQ